MDQKIYNSFGDKIFQAVNYIMLTVVTLTCLLPMLHVLALSLSDSVSTTANKVLFIPKGFNLAAYQAMFSNLIFLNSFLVSVFRTVVGMAINVFMTVLAAYPLSNQNTELRDRKLISLFFIIHMMISGGLISNYLLVNKLGMID